MPFELSPFYPSISDKCAGNIYNTVRLRFISISLSLCSRRTSSRRDRSARTRWRGRRAWRSSSDRSNAAPDFGVAVHTSPSSAGRRWPRWTSRPWHRCIRACSADLTASRSRPAPVGPSISVAGPLTNGTSGYTGWYRSPPPFFFFFLLPFLPSFSLVFFTVTKLNQALFKAVKRPVITRETPVPVLTTTVFNRVRMNTTRMEEIEWFESRERIYFFKSVKNKKFFKYSDKFNDD